MKEKFIRLWRSIRYYRVNRKYKDMLFRYIFQDKKDLLDLYNAINGTDYTNPDDLFITTLKDVIYLGFKNDVSFLVGCHLNLYEHQSTWNPNMPLRGFFYFADVIRGYIEEKELDIYSSRLVTIPMPQYIVFYNGTKDQPDKQVLRLSDAYEQVEEIHRSPGEASREPALECTAVVLNINYGHNKALMQKCRRLADYAYFVQVVRWRLEEGYSLGESVDLAVNECIEKDILADILRQHRAEVMNLILTVYNEKQHNKTLREEGRTEGREEGEKRLASLMQILLEEGRSEDAIRASKEKAYREKLYTEYRL